MCGIAGFVNRAGEAADRAIAERMTAALAHRGPDGDGIYCPGPVALGHRRLSIIDVSGGAQPLSNEDGTVWVTYNGELYNELELRPELERAGIGTGPSRTPRRSCISTKKTGSTSSSGSTACSPWRIWDEPRQRLVLARDRMGQKPLFHAALPGGGLVFGSEPKAILRHPQIARDLDQGSLARYLFYEYIPAPHSIWRGLSKLPRGHVLVWEPGGTRLFRYWDSPSAPA